MPTSSYEHTLFVLNQYSDKIGEMYNVVDLHSLLTTPDDFVYDIEPSESASNKIANLINSNSSTKSELKSN